MVPAVLFLGWEVLTPFLPGFLKMLSVVHYLGSLEPVPISQGPVRPHGAAGAGVARGDRRCSPSAAACSPSAAWKARGLEITYSTE